VLEQWTDGAHPDITYTIGADIISQSSSAGVRHLFYDGHGSTRQLIASDGSTVNDSFSYDAYGVMLGGNPAPGSSPATNLLYSGEQFDTDMQQYYLRARWYDQNNGRFNRMDPFAGNNQDPQSLHKYLYCHANPVNGIDPSGDFFFGLTLVNILIAVAVLCFVAAIVIPAIMFVRHQIIIAAPNRFLAEVRRYMESNGWYNVGPSHGPDGALAHAVANIIAVRSGVFATPQDALRAFQEREVSDEGLPAQMDRENNIIGNDIGQQPEPHTIWLLQNVQLVWIEEGELVEGQYPEPSDITRLQTLFELYGEYGE